MAAYTNTVSGSVTTVFSSLLEDSRLNDVIGNDLIGE